MREAAYHNRVAAGGDELSIVAGIDEAGYGPPLGPLVVSAVVFRVSDEHRCANLWKLLSRYVSANPRARRKLVVADSKKSYSTSKGVGVIEETSLCFLSLVASRFNRMDALLEALAGEEARDALNYPWYRNQDVEIPLSGRALGFSAKSERLAKTLEESGVGFLGVRCLPVFEAAFNRAIDETHNKHDLLFSQSARLIAGIMKRYAGEDIIITADKQGGRDRYGPPLGRRFKGARLVVRRQDRRVAHYHVRHEGSQSEIRFLLEGERYSMPVALASMFSKYVRECYMKLFNGFWRSHLPKVRTTAGYAEDAGRFLKEIAPMRERLGIPDDVLVRCR
jgi:ribonuclease HII